MIIEAQAMLKDAVKKREIFLVFPFSKLSFFNISIVLTNRNSGKKNNIPPTANRNRNSSPE
jgi:hypothetical protein